MTEPLSSLGAAALLPGALHRRDAPAAGKVAAPAAVADETPDAYDAAKLKTGLATFAAGNMAAALGTIAPLARAGNPTAAYYLALIAEFFAPAPDRAAALKAYQPQSTGRTADVSA